MENGTFLVSKDLYIFSGDLQDLLRLGNPSWTHKKK
jgi:hypothetical protein